VKKWSRTQQSLSKGRNSNVKKVHEKMLSSCDHKGNSNQNYTKILPHCCYNGYHQEHKQQLLAKMSHLIHCWEECKLLKPLWKTVWRLHKKLKIELLYDLTIPLLGIFPKECKSGYNKGTCTAVFIAALFTMAKLWKQPRFSTT
jgi:hypothetical protein